jgi:hypothetical protein
MLRLPALRVASLVPGRNHGIVLDSLEDDTMNGRVDLEDLQIEVWATQYWMKYLYVSQARGERISPKDIVDLIEEMKATSPPDDDASPAAFDERHVDRFPVYERIGLEIAALLADVGN